MNLKSLCHLSKSIITKFYGEFISTNVHSFSGNHDISSTNSLSCGSASPLVLNDLVVDDRPKFVAFAVYKHA